MLQIEFRRNRGPIPSFELHNSSINIFETPTLYTRVSSSHYQSMTIYKEQFLQMLSRLDHWAWRLCWWLYLKGSGQEQLITCWNREMLVLFSFFPSFCLLWGEQVLGSHLFTIERASYYAWTPQSLCDSTIQALVSYSNASKLCMSTRWTSLIARNWLNIKSKRNPFCSKRSFSF